MLTLWGAKQKFCDGMNRRNFLQIGAFELDAVIDRSRMQFQRDLLAGVQRHAGKASRLAQRVLLVRN